VPCVRPHVYWELEEPTRNLQAWSETQTRIKNVLATDSVTDPPRIMRLAGTINWPKPKKVAKGYKPELTTLNIFDPDVRPPVSSERLYRAFSGGASQTPGDTFDIDTGPQPMDRLAAINNALTDKNWNVEVFRLVGSYVAKGLADDEIHAITDRLTLPGYTIEQTRAEVRDMIVRTRNNPEFAREEQRREAFDHAPNAAPENTWRVQSAADFTADFVAPEYIVDGVIQRGRLYTLTAPTGSGKTAVMLYLATQIATGGQFCGKDVEQGDVLFLAGENPDDVRARVIATMEFYGIDPAQCRLHFIPGTFSIRADMERLRQEAAKLPNLMLVVVDTFAAYFDGEDENSNAQALDFARVVRTLTMFPSKPAVSMPAHPVKNATKGNLSPKGGSSLLNEVDGNLTLWKEGAAITMHWQGKFRGAEFDALTLELERYESDSLKDSKGRLIPTILAKPVLTLRAQQIARENLDTEDRMLLCVADSPEMPLQQRAQTCGLTYKTQAKRVLEKLMRQKLVKPFRSNWELTKDGERAVEIITSGGGFAADLDA